ncbi:hypothetical protein UY3_19050 [Chelonia mydas]|uniref:Uncharacterized protein n=1 Tax=Chelonia mydas TaxID=8469 RepID=M7AG71_CHEMY|nr:hypothetical protein UY3_19050 [Chelonia mydas]
MKHIKVVKINGREYLRQRDTGTQISLVKQSVVPKASMLPGQMAEIVEVGESRFLIPLAKIHVVWDGLESVFTVGIMEHLVVDLLLCNDFFHVAQVKVFACSRKEFYSGTLEEKGKVSGTAKRMGESLLDSSAAGGSHMLPDSRLVETSFCTAAGGNTTPGRDGGVTPARERTVQVVSCQQQMNQRQTQL